MASDRDDTKLPITTVVLLVATVVGGVWVYQAPLTSSRPATPDYDLHRLPGEHQVEARLWQDPLAAALAHAKTDAVEGQQARAAPPTIHAYVGRQQGAGATIPIQTIRVELPARNQDSHGLVELAEQIVERVAHRSVQTVTVLLAMTDGSMNAAAAETRLRDRYAIDSAIGVSCFLPEDAEHIHYGTWTRSGKPALIVPFEWYRPNTLRQCQGFDNQDADRQRVLVLWISEDDFVPDPLQELRRLVRLVTNEVVGRLCREQAGEGQAVCVRAGQGKVLEYKLIGARSSTILRYMLRDTLFNQPQVWPTHDGQIEMYSPWATASSDLLQASLLKNSEGRPDWMERQLGGHNVRLVFRTMPDFELAQTLIRELARRNVTVGQDTVAIIGEWDSLYGRTVPWEFTVAACMQAPECAGKSHWQALYDLKRPVELAKIQWVRRYIYLAGLDGEIPGGQKEKNDKGKESVKSNAKEEGKQRKIDLESLERPEGRSQLDYVRRLALRIDEEDYKLRSRCPLADRVADRCAGIKAIGVMGSDVYDKLLILQALRRRFPRAIFFTTDLDERLTHRTEYDWTRNLVVASHFGLHLHPDLQRGVPPFRDSYQTSAFFSVLMAIGQVTPDSPVRPGEPVAYFVEGVNTRLTAPAEARLFEVGRNGAVDISVQVSEPAETDLHPPRHDVYALWRRDRAHVVNHAVVGLACAGVLLAMCVPLWCVLRPSRRKEPNEPKERTTDVSQRSFCLSVWLGGAALLVGWVAWRFWRAYEGYGGEPMLLFDGVSIWPTEALRLLAACLSGLFLWTASRALRAGEAHFARDYSLGKAAPAALTVRDRLAWCFAPGTRMTADLVRRDGEDWIQGKALWQAYLAASSGRYRCVRVGAMVGVFWVLGAGMMALLGFPARPCRGVSCDIDWWMTVVSVSLLLALIFLIFDATVLSTCFIKGLNGYPTIWPFRFFRKQSRLANLEPRFLHDVMDIQLIAEHTQVVGKLIPMPFVTLFLMLAARSRYFDGWDLSVGLVLFLSASAGIAIVSGVLLRRAAEKARGIALRSLYELRLAVTGAGDDQEHRAKQLELMIDRIQSLREGAFAPFLQQPAVTATLLSTLGVLQHFIAG